MGEGGKSSSLWPGNRGRAKYLARSQWCSPCGPMCWACLPSPKSWVLSAPCCHCNPNLLSMLKKSKKGKGPCDCTGRLLEEMKNYPEQHPGISRKREPSYPMVDQNPPNTSNTNTPARATVASPFWQVLKYCGNNIGSLSGAYWYREHGLVMEVCIINRMAQEQSDELCWGYLF